MAWTPCTAARELIERRSATLEAQESLYNLTWAALHRAQQADMSARFTFFTYDEGRRSSAHALISHQAQHLIISEMSDDQAAQLIRFLDERGVELSELEGPREATHAALLHWSRRADRSYELQLTQGLYELTRVKSPALNGGQLTRAVQEHTALLQSWVTGFWRDCFPEDHISADQALKRAERYIRERRAHLWLTSAGEPVSMAVVVRESPNTASISGVYTPPQHRGQGYAGRVVASLSQAQLDAGKRACNLHTDLSNPTSNELYIRIGYRQISVGLRARLLSQAER